MGSCKMILILQSVDKILRFDHSNITFLAVLFLQYSRRFSSVLVKKGKKLSINFFLFFITCILQEVRLLTTMDHVLPSLMMIICLQDQLFYKTRNKMYDCNIHARRNTLPASQLAIEGALCMRLMMSL